jgi:hypothetical protein
MKKIVVFVLSALLIALSAFPAFSAFISSPSSNPAPEIVGSDNEHDDCDAEIVICAYGNRATLDDESRAELEEAYASIFKASDIGDLNEKLDDLAAKLQITTDKFIVSDLFDVDYAESDGHEGHGKFTVTIKSNMLKNFACMLHYHNDAWELVENTSLNEDKTQLTFTASEFSPFAIVVHDGSAVTPSGGDNLILIITLSAVGAAAVGGGVAFGVITYKKKKAK